MLLSNFDVGLKIIDFDVSLKNNNKSSLEHLTSVKQLTIFFIFS
jgi:hypothetical protein